jgi:hypothetical protein
LRHFTTVPMGTTTTAGEKPVSVIETFTAALAPAAGSLAGPPAPSPATIKTTHKTRNRPHFPTSDPTPQDFAARSEPPKSTATPVSFLTEPASSS